MFTPVFTTNAMTSDFLSLIFPGRMVMFLDSRHMAFTFLSWLHLLGAALAFWTSILQITSKLLTQGYRYHKLQKIFGKFFRSYSELSSKFDEISFQEYVSEGISHPVVCWDVLCKAKSRKNRGVFNVKNQEKTRQVRENYSQQLEHKQVL